MNRRASGALVGVGAVAILVSGWVHFRLYFRGGYRGIAPQSFAGLTISRSFALQAITAVVIAELLVVSLLLPRLQLPAAVAGILFAAGSLAAYTLSRTSGLLGFVEHSTTTDAVVALIAEAVAVVTLVPVALHALRQVRQAAADSAAPASSASA
jgi:hypothetical protein